MVANQPYINSIVIIDEKCMGDCEGEIQFNTVGGDPPYYYSIDNGVTVQSNPIFSNLCSGNYILYYSDSYGCGWWQPFTINAATPIIASIDTIIDVTCIGGCNGGVTLSVTGGTPPYSYLWNDSLAQTTPTASNLCAGTYICSVTDDNGCDTTISIVINEPIGDTLTATWNTTPESCFGACDGSAMVTPNGGIPPYTFLWDDPCLTTTDSSACAGCQGVYNCIITDDNGCSITVAGVTVGGPTVPLTVTSIVINSSCFDLCDGIITSSVTGGTPPYSYLWNDSLAQTTPTASNLCAGTYTCSVTDDNGCDTTITIVINGPNPLVATAAFVSNPTSIGACDGVANGSVIGGTAPYAFLWVGCPPTVSPNITTPIANGLCDGEYQIIITDANGCIDSSDCITIIDPPNNINENINTIINKIYPNPTGGLITIEFSDKALLPLTLEVIDVKGKSVKNYYLTDKNSIIDLTSLPKGAYILSNAKLSIHKTIILE
jgi:hypothetical protein